MASPQYYTIPVDTWVRVANGAKAGNVQPTTKGPAYVQVTRAFGTTAPTNGDLSGAKELPYVGGVINSSALIDVYVAVKGDTAGTVRVDP